VVNLLAHRVAVYLFLSSLLIGVFAFLVFGIGVLAQQGRALQRDLWRLRSELGAHNLSPTDGDRPQPRPLVHRE
jgi:hypothetical protein